MVSEFWTQYEQCLLVINELKKHLELVWATTEIYITIYSKKEYKTKAHHVHTQLLTLALFVP